MRQVRRTGASRHRRAYTVQEAVEAAQKLGGPVWVVKAQIHAGGRGKGGGVKVAKSDRRREDASPQEHPGHAAAQDAPDRPEGQKVRRLLHRRRRRHQEGTVRVGLVTDRATQKMALIASSEGGMDIEEVAHSTPEKIITELSIDPKAGMTDAQSRKEIADGHRHDRLLRHCAVARRHLRQGSTSATWTPTPRWSRSTR